MQLKNIGIFALLVTIVIVATSINGNFVAPANLKTLIRDTSLYGLISIGVAMVIITGGIDLSIGSMIALCGVLLVSVIDVHYVETDYQAKIIEVRTESDDGLQRPALRLSEPTPPIRDGDRLQYRGLSGDTRLNLLRTIDVSGQQWVETRDSVGSQLKGLNVSLQQIQYTNPYLACLTVLAFAALMGLVHGLLITRANLPSFVVTLCGLLIYRGAARISTGNESVGLGTALEEFKSLGTGSAFEFPLPFVGRISGQSDSWTQISWIDFPATGVLLVVVAVIGWVFLNRTVWGRHLLATGENEQAARFSGVRTKSLTTLSYVVCGLLAGLTGILFTLEWNSIQPTSAGNFYELYAIAAAVLGGCSLRGGRGAILGVIAGAAVLRCLYKAIGVLEIPQEWEMLIIGVALLASVSFDEIVRIYRSQSRIKPTST